MTASDWPAIAGVRVVGITGAARHGKDELARALVRRIAGAERFAFSDAVAAVARATGRMERRNAFTLQQIGTAYRAERGVDVWLSCLYGAIDDKRPPVAVVTGVRYPNEAELIRSMGGLLVGVVRPEAPALVDRDPSHEAESHVAGLLAAADHVFTFDEMSDDRARAEVFLRSADDVASMLTEGI